MIPDQSERITTQSHAPAAGRFGNLSESIGSNRWRRHLVFFCLGLFVISGLMSIVTEDPNLASNPIVKETSQDVSKNKPKAIALEQEETLTLKNGQTLIEAIRRADVPSRAAHNAVNQLGKVLDVRRLFPGQKIHLQ